MAYLRYIYAHLRIHRYIGNICALWVCVVSHHFCLCCYYLFVCRNDAPLLSRIACCASHAGIWVTITRRLRIRKPFLQAIAVNVVLDSGPSVMASSKQRPALLENLGQSVFSALFVFVEFAVDLGFGLSRRRLQYQ